METRAWEVNKSEAGTRGSTVQDFLYFEGVFSPFARFAFTNVLDEPFESKWDGVPYAVKPHETVKLKHHLAHKFTKELVDRLMMADNRGMAMAVPENRKPYEDRVLALLPEERGTEMEIVKAEFLEQLKHDTSRPEGVPDGPVDNLEVDFEDLTPKNFQEEPKAKPKPPKARQ